MLMASTYFRERHDIGFENKKDNGTTPKDGGKKEAGKFGGIPSTPAKGSYQDKTPKGPKFNAGNFKKL